jgi:hypothetical protein
MYVILGDITSESFCTIDPERQSLGREKLGTGAYQSVHWERCEISSPVQ